MTNITRRDVDSWTKDLKFVTPPKNQGQIVLVSYACDTDYIYERSYDQSDRSESIAVYEHPAEEREWDPQNGVPVMGERIELMPLYTYTIFDSDPNSSSGTGWPDHRNVELEADSDESAIEAVREIMQSEASALSPSDGYEVGQKLYAIVWSEDEAIVGHVTYDLTVPDLGVDKSDVDSWETAATFVATYPEGDEQGACDVEVQIGEAHGVWFVRTQDDAGGSDDADDTAYASREEAAEAADAYAAQHDEGNGDENAEEYLRRCDEEAAGEPDPNGPWCVYWESAIKEDEGQRERYATKEQAEAAAKLANLDLRERNPGGNLLCGFDVRQLVDGEWVQVDDT